MTRAERRHQMERMKQRVRTYYRGYFIGTPDEGRCIGKYAQTRSVCSCPMCGNPRRHFGQRTIQEQRYADA